MGHWKITSLLSRVGVVCQKEVPPHRSAVVKVVALLAMVVIASHTNHAS